MTQKELRVSVTGLVVKQLIRGGEDFKAPEIPEDGLKSPEIWQRITSQPVVCSSWKCHHFPRWV